MKIELEDTFGDILRKATRGTKTSLERLSRETGTNDNRLSQFLSDKAQPTDAEAKAIAKALDLDQRKLADSGARRWYPKQPPQPAFLAHQINAPHPSNGYFIVRRAERVAAFVDPAGNPHAIIDGFKNAGIAPQYILVTHKHLDHSDALGAVRKAFPKSTAVINLIDGAEVGSAARDAIDAKDGLTLPFGSSEIRVLYTPGHTDGSVCFSYEGSIFTGDTLFSGSVGRLFGESHGYGDLLRNIRTRIFSLPENTAVYPGHGPASTVEQEIAHNPFFS